MPNGFDIESPFLDQTKEEPEVAYYKRRLLEELSKLNPDVANAVNERFSKTKVKARLPSNVEKYGRKMLAKEEMDKKLGLAIPPGFGFNPEVWVNPANLPDVGLPQDIGEDMYEQGANTVLHELEHTRGVQHYPKPGDLMSPQDDRLTSSKEKKKLRQHYMKNRMSK
jgi:hypothetical protein